MFVLYEFLMRHESLQRAVGERALRKHMHTRTFRRRCGKTAAKRHDYLRHSLNEYLHSWRSVDNAD